MELSEMETVEEMQQFVAYLRKIRVGYQEKVERLDRKIEQTEDKIAEAEMRLEKEGVIIE